MIRFRALGALDLLRSEGPEIRSVLAQPKRVALLAYLAVARPPGFHRRDRLLAMFWPDAGEERARASLSRAIYFLRRELGDDVVVNRGDDEISINPDRLWCDAAAFESHLDRGQPREALDLYRGDLLPGFFTSDANGFEAWLEGERARLRDLASEGAWRLADAEKSAGNVSLAAHWASRAVTLAPFREEGVRRLLALLDASGDRAAAVQAYEQFKAHVSKELELAPAPETIALIEEIRSRSRSTFAKPRQVDDGTRTAIAETAAVFIPPPVQRPRVVRRWWVGVAAATIVVAPAIVLARELWGQLDTNRVFVARFANLTGDANFDALGRLAADQIIQSVASTGLVDVAAPDAADSTRDGAVRSRVDVATEAGRQHRAGVVVSGEIHNESGRLSVQARITDVAGSRVAWAVPGIMARPDSLQHAIDELTARTTGAVAALATPRFATWFPAASSPPKFAAFQEFAQAVELQLRGGHQDALAHLLRAVAIDSTFIAARLQLAQAYVGVYEEPTADSIIEVLNGVRQNLTPLQRHWLDWMISWKKEDPVGGYQAVRAAAEIAPDRFLFNVAEWAMRLNRPKEARRILGRLGPDSPYNNSADYWGLLTQAHHAVGDRKRELAASREARTRYPDRLDMLSFEVAALAAYGRVGEVRALIDTALVFPLPKTGVPGVVVDMLGVGLWPGRLMVTAAREFRAHGFAEAADENLKRAIGWYTTQPPPHGSVETHRLELARVLYFARDWSAAEAMFRSLAAADPHNVIYSGFLGTIAARRGDTTAARQVLAHFDSLKPTLARPNAIAGYWQSKINALLDDEERAMRALAETFGPQGRSGMHSDFDFEGIWKSRAFREFVKPKG